MSVHLSALDHMVKQMVLPLITKQKKLPTMEDVGTIPSLIISSMLSLTAKVAGRCDKCCKIPRSADHLIVIISGAMLLLIGFRKHMEPIPPGKLLIFMSIFLSWATSWL